MISAREASERALEARTPKTVNGKTFDDVIELQNEAIMEAVSNGKWNTKYLFYEEYWDSAWSEKANKYYMKNGLGYHTFKYSNVMYIAW